MIRTFSGYLLAAAIIGMVTPSVTSYELRVTSLGATNQQSSSNLTSDPDISETTGLDGARTSYVVPRNSTPDAAGQLVQFKTETDPIGAAEQLDVSTSKLEQLDDRTYYVAEGGVDERSLEPLATVEPNGAFTILGRPDDPAFGNQVGLSNISATNAWDLETGSSTIRIAVLDSGVNGLHEDLFGKVVEGYDFVNDRAIGRNSDSDDHGHGTAVASVAAAVGNNGRGLAGMAWNVEIIPIKVINSSGAGSTREVMLGVQYAVAHGANIILMSIGSHEDNSSLRDAIDEAWKARILTVASAGNDGATGPSSVLYPARYPRVLAVGSTDGSDARASFSSVGLELDLMAPGTDIYHATDSDSGYGLGSGTSFAAPFVAGTAALALSTHPGIDPGALHDLLRDTADKVAGMGGAGRTDFYGYGRLNARRALEAAKGNYAGKLVSRTENIPSLGSTQSWQIEYRYQNTGTSTWKRVGPSRMELSTAGSTDHTLPFVREDLVGHQPSGWLTATRVGMVEDEVRPGGIGTFRFYIGIPSGMTGQRYTESMQLVVRGGSVLAGTAADFTVNVLTEADRYHAKYVGQTPNPTLTPGGSAKFQVFYRNEGNATWTRQTVKLGTSHERDRVSAFAREDTTNGNPSGWSSPTRVSLDQEVVAPGQLGSFTFYLSDTAAIAPGTYREYFQPLADGITWMEDHGLFWDLIVR